MIYINLSQLHMYVDIIYVYCIHRNIDLYQQLSFDCPPLFPYFFFLQGLQMAHGSFSIGDVQRDAWLVTS